jgi:uncharacterized protein
VGAPDSQDTKDMLTALGRIYAPGKVLLFKGIDDKSGIESVAEFTKGQSSINGKATAYVCLNHICKLPTTDLHKALELLSQ